MIINQNGKIAFKGHPHVRLNLEADIDTLLAGKELAGVKPLNEDDDQNPKDFVEMNKAQVDGEIQSI